MAFITICYFKAYYYLISFWILDLSISIVKDIYLLEEIDDLEHLKGIEFVYIACLNISDLLAGFLVLYTKIRSKTKRQTIEEQEKKEKEKENQSNKKKISYELIYNDTSMRNYKYGYIFLVSLLEFIARSTNLLFILIFNAGPIRPGQVNWLISLDIMGRIFFSRLILRKKVYKHHIFSLILIIIGLFSMSICAFNSISENGFDRWPYFIFVAVRNLIFPLEDVICKILLTDDFLLPHYLMFLRGFFNFFMVLIMGLSLIIPGKINFSYFSAFEGGMLMQVLMKVVFTIFSFWKSFCLLKVIDIFSPQHVAFLKSAFSLYQLIECRYKAKDNLFLTIFDGVFLIVIIFATLMFNEMMIINKWGLNKNTKVGFLKKEQQEIQEIRAANESDEESDNEDNYSSKNETKK